MNNNRQSYNAEEKITALYCREDGVCVQQSCAVNRSVEK